ncbi:hypothetical protein A3H75_02145 [Candidatus Uhrbacteria bacterium RIFCSPLOWO2_02_FULL_51_9]|uniref:Uncharacterized protein n=1 Tax=Candidatus Uhrbacteria bacterium RIFCSPLOWO2_02_FULL_51_9 TaxID=1802410 RepID=A0A1F7VFQ9_9BACT|nr:MAG: hypothetical protein A3H75_02145 [Candidatus Uhrbacteria bacterium RIFCSPLOWO2_02_FULL_51_9]
MKNKVTDTELARALWHITRDATDENIAERVRVFVEYLHTHGMLHRGERIAACFSDVARRQEGKSELVLESAHPVSEALIAEIQQVLSCADATVITKQNPALVGGVIARVNDVVYDMSVTAQLQRLTAQLIA